MWEALLVAERDAIAPTGADRAGRPLTDGIEGQDRRLLKGEGKNALAACDS